MQIASRLCTIKLPNANNVWASPTKRNAADNDTPRPIMTKKKPKGTAQAPTENETVEVSSVTNGRPSATTSTPSAPPTLVICRNKYISPYYRPRTKISVPGVRVHPGLIGATDIGGTYPPTMVHGLACLQKSSRVSRLATTILLARDR